MIKHSRGPQVAPTLAGFGYPLTNRLFEKAFEARTKKSAFSLQMNSDKWSRGSGTLLVAGLKWTGAARRLRSADSVVGCSLPDAGAQWMTLREDVLMKLALQSQQGPPDPKDVESGQARKLVQGELRRLVETQNPNGRAAAD